MENKKLYEERLKRINTAWEKGIPDRIPLTLQMYSWAVFYYKESMRDVYCDKLDTLGGEVFARAAKEFNFDSYFTLPFNVPFKMTDMLGGGHYRLMDTGVQVSNLSANLMSETEYKQFTEDYIGFSIGTLIPRKFASLCENKRKSLDLITKAHDEWKKFGVKMNAATKIVEDSGCPALGRGGIFHPIDFIMDYFRDFSGIITDVRRRPSELKDALAMLNKFLMKQSCTGNITGDDGHTMFWPAHIPTFLKPKDFNEFYLPYMNEQLEYAMNKYGNKVGIWLEGDWTQHYDALQTMPDNDGKLLLMQEKADFKELKAKLGHKACISGGLSVAKLAYSTKEVCVDMTKSVIDDIAAGGGFILATDKAFLTLSDAKAENLRAVIDTVIDYGRY